MSSVIVKGMKMPENCDVCMFSKWSNLRQTASCQLKEYEPCFAEFSDEYKSKRADFCPLVALPDKHGRLVDADALRDRLRNLADDDWNANTTTTWSEAFSECDDMVDDAPTIVEKES